MSFIAKISVDGEALTVLHCSYRFTQQTDGTGKPVSVPHGGFINLVVESTSETSFFDWMINPTQTKNGSITFYRRDSMSKLKTIDFTEAYCVDYSEIYNHEGDHPMQVQISISAKEITLNGSPYKNNWPE
jgi:type VI protein secretion system component Hcp